MAALCLIGLGSNRGDRVGHLLSALEELRRNPAIDILRTSSFVESRPVGGPAGQGNFFNAAALLETQLTPAELLETLLATEQKLGRERQERWGPRAIDLDLLLYADQVLETPQLQIPHPVMHVRRFVLAPAAEIAPEMRHPIQGRTVSQLLDSLGEPCSELGMRVATEPGGVQSEVLKLRRAGRRVGLVPTMGALHEGHLSLIETARRQADTVVATIFVNPAQFGPHEDYGKYPRTLESDVQALSGAGCDLVFVPSQGAIYPPGFSTYVDPPAVAEPLEGVCRPGHFRGVATVVLKLFQLIPADFACFGQKDYQQLLVIRHMVRDLAVPIEIVACPTIRQADGLALSSRNRYLSPAERQQALGLPQALARAAHLAAGGEKSAAAIVAEMHQVLATAGIERIDYASVADPETLAPVERLYGPAVALIAAHVGTTRLIDNRLLTPDF